MGYTIERGPLGHEVVVSLTPDEAEAIANRLDVMDGWGAELEQAAKEAREADER